MNDKITISLLQLFEMFPDQESARLYLESRLWPAGVCCPVCATQDRITGNRDGIVIKLPDADHALQGQFKRDRGRFDRPSRKARNLTTSVNTLTFSLGRAC